MFEWILNKIRKDNKGFTLIELVVVIAILAILAFIAVPRLAGTTDKAAKSAHNANVRTLESAASMCIAEEGLPKTDITDWKGQQNPTSHKWDDYIQEWPKVPKGIKGKNEKVYDGTEEYTVKIDTDGKIEVIPEKE